MVWCAHFCARLYSISVKIHQNDSYLERAELVAQNHRIFCKKTTKFRTVEFYMRYHIFFYNSALFFLWKVFKKNKMGRLLLFSNILVGKLFSVVMAAIYGNLELNIPLNDVHLWKCRKMLIFLVLRLNVCSLRRVHCALCRSYRK